MAGSKINTFEIVLLVVGVGAALLGFQLINQAFNAATEISWLMVIAIFSWLTLLVLFILLSITVDVSKKQHRELQNLVYILSQKKGKK